MLATQEAQVIPVTQTKHFSVLFSSGTPVPVDVTGDFGVWTVVLGGLMFLRYEDVHFCDACLLSKPSLPAESYMETLNSKWYTEIYY